MNHEEKEERGGMREEDGGEGRKGQKEGGRAIGRAGGWSEEDGGWNRREKAKRETDVKSNCFDVKLPKRKFEKRVKRGGRSEIGDRISRPLDVWVGMRWERFAPT